MAPRAVLAEEVVVVDNLSLLVLLQVVEVLGRDLEHVAGTLAVRGRDERRIEVEEAVLVEIGVDGHGHVVADAHDGTERVGAQAHVGVLAHVLEGLALLLHGIVGTAGAQHLNLCGLNLHGLAAAHALHEVALHAEACAGGDELHQLIVEAPGVGHHLYVLDGAAVVEGYEIDALRAATGAHPSFGAHLPSRLRGEKVNYLCSFHCVDCF